MAEPARSLAWWVAAAVAVQVATAAAWNLDAVSGRAPERHNDVWIYRGYASRVLGGEVPFRDFDVEYPPLAVPLFVAPALIAPGPRGYRIAFGLEMLAFDAVTVALLAGHVARREGNRAARCRLAWYSLAFALLAKLIVARFDAASTALAFAAAVAWGPGRRGLAGAALAAVGTMIKLYPAIVGAIGSTLDAVRGRSWRDRTAGGLAFVAVSAAVSAGWLALCGSSGIARSIAYHTGRGLEYGSVTSGVSMLAAKAHGEEIRIVRNHVSYSVEAPGSAMLAAILPWVQAAATLGASILAIRRGGCLVRASGAGIVAFILTGKVFSPQYWLWPLPFVAAAAGRGASAARWLFLAGAATALAAQGLAATRGRVDLVVLLAYNLRNALVVALLAALVSRTAPRTVHAHVPPDDVSG